MSVTAEDEEVVTKDDASVAIPSSGTFATSLPVVVIGHRSVDSDG